MYSVTADGKFFTNVFKHYFRQVTSVAHACVTHVRHQTVVIGFATILLGGLQSQVCHA